MKDDDEFTINKPSRTCGLHAELHSEHIDVVVTQNAQQPEPKPTLVLVLLGSSTHDA